MKDKETIAKDFFSYNLGLTLSLLSLCHFYLGR